MDIKRDKKGRFVEHSNLDSKTLGVRLFKEDREKLEKIAQEQNIPPGTLVRNMMHKLFS